MFQLKLLTTCLLMQVTSGFDYYSNSLLLDDVSSFLFLGLWCSFEASCKDFEPLIKYYPTMKLVNWLILSIVHLLSYVTSGCCYFLNVRVLKEQIVVISRTEICCFCLLHCVA